jgi:hypothetical protein
MDKKHYTIGITLTDAFTADDFTDFIKTEYENLDTSKLKPAYLFHLDENIMYYTFEADAILLDMENGTHYHLSTVDCISPVENKDIIGFIDGETSEIELIN